MATFQTAGYPVPPAAFATTDYFRTPPMTPPHAGGHAYYSPRHYSHNTSSTPSKAHHRRSQTNDVPTGTYTTTYTTTYTSPRKQAHYSTDFGYFASAQSTPQRKNDYVPIYTPADNTARQGHRRRASYAAKPTPTPQRQRPSTATKEKPAPPKPTEEDARKAGIPAGYSLKNWDPTEEPILLLGSVFDANSLGKWIYDWTVFTFGPSTPMTEIAGELWLLLIQLAYKIKRAEENFSNIRSASNRDMIDDFLESGERLWQRFNKLLKICENYMWKVAKRENPGSKNITMGKNSGCEFVDAIFGRDRELERTEKLMTGMRLWSMRFDANCEEILKNPSA